MKILITGSTTGLGLLAGKLLLKQGHDVVLHARNKNSAITEKVPYVFGDLSKPYELKSLASQINEHGQFDAIIQNAGVYTSPAEEIFNVNVLAPYKLSTLVKRPTRMIYLSSGMHLGGHVNLNNIRNLSYSDSKLYVLMLSKYFARHWKDSFVNSVDPGWVPTRMGGSSAPDDLQKGAETQCWLSVSNDPSALVSGKYFHHREEKKSNPEADSTDSQDQLVEYLESL